jgi:release factor glutamine methyltransferase
MGVIWRFFTGPKMTMSNSCGLKDHRAKDLLQWAVSFLLRKCNAETPRLDAEVLLAHAMKKDRLQLYLDLEVAVDEESESYYRSLIGKRSACTPVSYLTGHKEFMSLDFMVNEDVLIPRPETEVLVETVCSLGKPGGRILELGTGSGAIAVSLAKYNPDWHIVATDLSFEALMVARENARCHRVIDRICFLQGDLSGGIAKSKERKVRRRGSEEARGRVCEVEWRRGSEGASTRLHASSSPHILRNTLSHPYTPGPFDWVVSNPPYIPTRDLARLPDGIRKYEPVLALDGGADGLDVIRRIIAEAYTVLKPAGRLALEIGYGQSEDVQKIADETGRYSDYFIVKDYSGIPRVFYCSRRI